MDQISHWIGMVSAIGFVVVCLIGFVKGLSLSPNETRVQGRGEHWTNN